MQWHYFATTHCKKLHYVFSIHTRIRKFNISQYKSWKEKLFHSNAVKAMYLLLPMQSLIIFFIVTPQNFSSLDCINLIVFSNKSLYTCKYEIHIYRTNEIESLAQVDRWKLSNKKRENIFQANTHTKNVNNEYFTSVYHKMMIKWTKLPHYNGPSIVYITGKQRDIAATYKI